MNLSMNTIKKAGAAILACLMLTACYESDITAGGAHTVAYTEEGILYAWGRNDSNQVGNGDTSRSVEIPTVIDLPLPKDVAVVDIKANLNFTLLLDSAGDVWVWGTNDQGQVGNGTVDSVVKPTKIEALDHVFVTDIGAGQRHALAVSLKGEVWAWGNNGAGQVGIEVPDGDDPRAKNILAPVRVPGLKDVVDVEGGGSFSLAITRRGKVYSWGDNDNGQLGVDPLIVDQRHTPQLVEGIYQYAVAVAGGKDHAVALLHDGSMMSWGLNFAGQLGIGTNENVHVPTPVNAAGIKMRQIAASGNFTIAISKDRRLFSWGQNLLGSLGTGTEDTNIPLQVDFFSQPVINAANGLGHTIVTTLEEDGTEGFWTFGLNSFDQIGIEGAPFANYIPQRVMLN